MFSEDLHRPFSAGGTVSWGGELLKLLLRALAGRRHHRPGRSG